jgi:hypothetical protein
MSDVSSLPIVIFARQPSATAEFVLVRGMKASADFANDARLCSAIEAAKAREAY